MLWDKIIKRARDALTETLQKLIQRLHGEILLVWFG